MSLKRPTTRDGLLQDVATLVDQLETTFKAKDADKLDGIDSLGFLQLASAGTHKVAFGKVTLTFSGSATSGTQTVTHGLGGTPAGIGCVPVNGIAWCLPHVQNVGATTFDVYGRDTDATARTGTNDVYWIAIA